MRLWWVVFVCVFLASTIGCDVTRPRAQTGPPAQERGPAAAPGDPAPAVAPERSTAATPRREAAAPGAPSLQRVDLRVSAGEGAPSLDCFLEARRHVFDELAWELCRSARSLEPVSCYVEADRLVSRSPNQNVALCRCALSVEPVSCFDRARRETMLSDTRIEELCNARMLFGLRDDCLPICPRDWL